MSDLKGRQVFQHHETSTEAELTSQRLFEKQALEQQVFDQKEQFVPQVETPEIENDEPELEQTFKGSNKKGWLATGLIASFAGLVGWQAIDSVITAVTQSDWLTLGWSAFIAAIASLGIGAIGKEMLTLRRLKRHFSVQEQAEQIIDDNGVGKGESFCVDLAQQGAIKPENPAYDRWKNSVQSVHSDAEILDMYQSMVLSQQDKQALKVVSRLSGEAAILVALSPLAIADMLLIAWRNFKMIDKISQVYGVELSYWSRLKLFKLVLINIALAGASELAIETGADLLSMNLTEKLSTRAGQGLGVALVTARLGLKTMSLMRPIPFSDDNKPKLSAIRKQVIDDMKLRLSK
ncbi:YcjF family protein [Vibrio hippocampi]|uniref:TIGR01620 family protein n=1 Tax=Vibrio hippocampi TaxID=654686 RepID=A0ABM8ZG63_9VIBR|nr:TIGR01620 family protein [Vibrio hippocampi]CAH0525632.1 hypothetical protein VHP8226_01160 [Vibrio hippocampi]